MLKITPDLHICHICLPTAGFDGITEFYIENKGIPYTEQDEYKTYGIISGDDCDAIKDYLII